MILRSSRDTRNKVIGTNEENAQTHKKSPENMINEQNEQNLQKNARNTEMERSQLVGCSKNASHLSKTFSTRIILFKARKCFKNLFLSCLLN